MRNLIALAAFVPLLAGADESNGPEVREEAPPEGAQPVPNAQDLPPQPSQQTIRGAWYVGFGFGLGAGNAHFDHATASDFFDYSSAPLSWDFHVGATLTQRLLVGVDFGAVGGGTSSSHSRIDLLYVELGAYFT